MPTTPTTRTFRALADEFLTIYEPPGRAATTCRLMRQTIRELSEDPLLIHAADLSPAALWRWIRRYPERTPITTALHLRNLRCFAGYAVGRGALPSSPFAYDRTLRKLANAKKTDRRRHHSLAQIGCVLGHLRDRSAGSWEGGRLFALASLVAYTGVRAQEAQFAEVSDFDLADGFFRVEPKAAHRLKTDSSERDVPIPPPLASVLAAWLPRARSTWAFPGVKRLGPWTSGMVGSRPVDRLQGAGLAVGVRGFTFLSLRHSYITHGSGPWGLGSIQIQQIAGHSIEDTQRHYLGRDRTNLRAAVAMVSFPIPDPLPRRWPADDAGAWGFPMPRWPRTSAWMPHGEALDGPAREAALAYLGNAHPRRVGAPEVAGFALGGPVLMLPLVEAYLATLPALGLAGADPGRPSNFRPPRPSYRATPELLPRLQATTPPIRGELTDAPRDDE